MAAEGGAGNLAKHYRETSFFGIVQVARGFAGDEVIVHVRVFSRLLS